jgi:hypothetical protein
MNQIEITDHQVDVLGKAISERLETIITCPALFENKPRKGRRTHLLSFESESMTAKDLGDFAHIIAEYCVGVRVWINEKQEITASVHFYYTHTTGGQNGSELDFVITGNLDGTDIVIVKKKRE